MCGGNGLVLMVLVLFFGVVYFGGGMVYVMIVGLVGFGYVWVF